MKIRTPKYDLPELDEITISWENSDDAICFSIIDCTQNELIFNRSFSYDEYDPDDIYSIAFKGAKNNLCKKYRLTPRVRKQLGFKSSGVKMRDQ